MRATPPQSKIYACEEQLSRGVAKRRSQSYKKSGTAFPEPLRLLMRTNCASRHTQMKAYPDCNGDRVKTCPDCNGDGVVDKDTDDERQCPTCGGLGFVPDDDKDHEEVIKTSRDLPHRQGAAWTRSGASRQHCQTANATRQALGL